MTTNKTNYTRKQFIIDMLGNELTTEQRECAEQWLAALEKKVVRTPNPRKVAERNRLREAIYEAIAANNGADISASWLANHVNGVMTPQKATSLVADLIREGRVRKREGKRVFYEAI